MGIDPFVDPPESPLSDLAQVFVLFEFFHLNGFYKYYLFLMVISGERPCQKKMKCRVITETGSPRETVWNIMAVSTVYMFVLKEIY